MTNTAAQIKAYRELIAADSENYDGELDVAAWWIRDNGLAVTPSELGKALKAPTAVALSLIEGLVKLGWLVGDDRGAWTRYSAR